MRWNCNIHDVDPMDPLWLLVPRLMISLGIASAALLIAFYLYAGELSLFAVAFVIFLDVLVTVVVIGQRFVSRKDAVSNTPSPVGKFDKLGGLWLFACTFGPFVSWMIANLGKMLESMHRWSLFAAAAVSIVGPLVTMLPNIRYVNRRSSLIQLPINIVVTALAMSAGFYYLNSFLQFRSQLQ